MNGKRELPSAHSWIGYKGDVEVTADSFTQALSRRKGEDWDFATVTV